MTEMPVSGCKWIELPLIADPRGKLTFVEGAGRHVPFEIKRIWYSYDIPEGTGRGGHAHKELEQFMIVLAGGLTVGLDDGFEKTSLQLEKPHHGLYVPPGTWVDLTDIRDGCVCLTLASDYYDESDYLRNYEDFLTWTRQRSGPS